MYFVFSLGFFGMIMTQSYNNRPIFLLSIDGGGILGLLALQTLIHLEKRMNRPISSLFDAITGVSAGGIIALGLAAPNAQTNQPAYSAQQLSRIFLENAKKIFNRTPMQNMAHRLPLWGLMDSLFFAKYSNQNAAKVYKHCFQETRLSQSLTQTIVPTYNISWSSKRGPRIKIFDSLAVCEKQKTLGSAHDFAMHDIALATSAAPTYFSPHRMQSMGAQNAAQSSADYFIDAGVAINDPTILGYSLLRKRYPHSPIHTLSLGVGTPPYLYESIIKNASPGALSWALQAGHLVVSPQLSVYQKILKQWQQEAVAPGGYWRIQPLRASINAKLDDISPKNLHYIATASAHMLEYHRHDLDAIVFYLSQK